MACEIKDYPHEEEWPKRLPDCRAEYKEGIPPSYILEKLEETDMGQDIYENYLDDVECQTYAYMRNAVTDRNFDEPMFEEDMPTYNATKNSGALNIRYNENRGTTDYQPAHPELFMGDLGASKDTGIKLAKLKRHTAAQADMARAQMGNDTDFQVWEQAWAQPDISYAIKDAQRWVANNLDVWQWPSFINQTYSSSDGIIRDDETRKNRADCAWKDYGDTVDTDMQFYDSNGKVKKQNIGYNVRGGDDQDHQGVKFKENFMNHVTKQKERTDIAKVGYSVKGNNTNLTDNSNMTKVFKGQLAHAMQSAIRDQEQTQDMKKSVQGKQRSGERMYKHKSVIKDIVKTQKERLENPTITTKGVIPSQDYGSMWRNVDSTLPWFLELNKNTMIKAARGELDATKAQRNIIQSYLMSQEVANRMKANGCLRDNQDRQAILRDIQQQHKTGCETHAICRGDKMAGHGLEQARKDFSDYTQNFGDDYHTKVMSTKKLPQTLKSRTDGADFDNNTFTDFTNTEGRNRW